MASALSYGSYSERKILCRFQAEPAGSVVDRPDLRQAEILSPVLSGKRDRGTGV